MGYPNGMERQAIAIRFSLPVASANSLHSLFKACASLAYNTKHYETIAYFIIIQIIYAYNFTQVILQECKNRIDATSLLF